ncbi:MAG TPA: type II toxin-antitoxin system VapC family toxin [Gemmataceae bacterium]|nr:type II toxin-antitoxin system VapC family toxin [Gemmataceae bacterium]
MSLYVLDTDIVSLFQHDDAAVAASVQRHPIEELAITVLTVEEQLSGWYNELRKAKKPAILAAVYQQMALTVQFLGHLPILSFTEPAIKRYEALQELKLKVKKTDLRIAAIVLEQNAVLVTRNARDFSRVPGLRIEDWSKPK